MSIRAALAKIRQAKADLIANREAEVLRIAFDQVALTKLRIQTSGEAANGAQFSPYTKDYAKERQGKGYQVGFVDFTRTGRMFANIRPRLESKTDSTATVVIESADQTTRDILAGQSRKRGNILEPSAKELEIVRAANRKRVLKYFNF